MKFDDIKHIQVKETIFESDSVFEAVHISEEFNTLTVLDSIDISISLKGHSQTIGTVHGIPEKACFNEGINGSPAVKEGNKLELFIVRLNSVIIASGI